LASVTKSLAGTISEIASGRCGTGNQSWTNVANVASSDSSYATATLTTSVPSTYYIRCTDFGFNLPSDVTVTAVQIEIQQKASLANRAQLKCATLTNAGSDITVDISASSYTPTVEAYTPIGSASNLIGWGISSLSPTIVNSSTFGVKFNASGYDSVLLSINHVRVTVYYNCSAAQITTNSLPDGIKDTAYSTTLTGTPSGGTWELTTGVFPSGVTLNGTTGVISGTPTETGTFPVTIKYTEGSPCEDTSIAKNFSLLVYAIASKTLSDLVASVTETISLGKQDFDFSIANNNQAYVLNLNTGYWTYIDDCPFVNAVYRTSTKQIIGTRRDIGQLSVINSGETFDGDEINSIVQDGYMNFGELDEIKAMPAADSESNKQVRAYYADIKGEADLDLTIYTEQDSVGENFTLDLYTVDNITVNTVQTALSRDIKGKYISQRIANVSGHDFEVFERRIKIKPRNIT
jgi:hypothetical protein